MARIINVCGNPKCCPRILEKGGMYKIFDKNWETGFMSRKTLEDLKKALNNLP